MRTKGKPSILVVDDEASIQKILKRNLQASGYEVRVADNGRLALDMVRQQHPDLILLDLHLPDLPGEEVLRRLWADPRTRDLPVAVLSADAMPEQRQRLVAAGAVAYLTKPVDIRQLLQLIDERLTPGDASGGTAR